MIFEKIYEEVGELTKELEKIEKRKISVYSEYIDKLEQLRKLKNLTLEEVARGTDHENRQYSYNILKLKKGTYNASLPIQKFLLNRR